MKKSQLVAFSKKKFLNIVVETPKGSRNKYAYDFELGLLRLKKALPAGLVFPFDFGAVPGTQAADGDPLDVLVLMEDPVPPGCLVEAQLVGVIVAEQTEDGKTERNDRLVAIATGKERPSEVQSLKKLDAKALKEVEAFFITYNRLCGKKFKVLKYGGPKAALKLVKQNLVDQLK